MYIRVPMEGEIWRKVDVLKSTLASNELTQDFTMVSDLPVYLQTGDVNMTWRGKDPNQQILIPHMYVDENFKDVFEVDLLVGRGFSDSFGSDSMNYVINEKAMRVMGFDEDNVIGEQLDFDDKKGPIVGEVKDCSVETPGNSESDTTETEKQETVLAENSVPQDADVHKGVDNEDLQE